MVFDDEGIYVFAEMLDCQPDSISRELGKRDSDNEINADWFSVDLCPFDDGINGFSFKLTVTGVQTDIRRGSGSAGRDVTWTQSGNPVPGSMTMAGQRKYLFHSLPYDSPQPGRSMGNKLSQIRGKEEGGLFVELYRQEAGNTISRRGCHRI
jgi:hypothetical protein